MKKLFTFLPYGWGKLTAHIWFYTNFTKTGLCISISLLLCYALATAQPTLVKDINAQFIQKLNPLAPTNVNGILYFSGYDAIHGQELWRSDGTPEGTYLVKDINPGLGNSNPSRLIEVNGTLYFIANQYEKAISYYTKTGGYELWKSDGTLAGTQLVNSVDLGSWEIEEGGPAPILLTKAGNTVFYSSGNNPYSYTLSSTRGVNIGIQRGFDEEDNTLFTEVNNTLYISGVTSYGNALIRTDGTEEGTSLLKEYAGALPRNLTSVNGTLFFTVYDPINKHALWKSDGTTEGTVLVKSIPDMSYSFQFNSPTAMNGTLFFSVGSILWKSNGTAEGTVPVKEFASNSFVNSLRAVNGTLFFIANDDISGEGLWKSDGTPNGTVKINITLPGDAGINMGMQSNGILYFSTYENYPSHDFSLWRSDGTTTGTFKLADFTNPLHYFNQIMYYTDVNGKMFFVPDYNDLWKSDGTLAGTVKINITSSEEASDNANPQYVISTAGNLYFGASDGLNGQELWKSDGTSGGTVLVKDINPGLASGNPQYLTAASNIVYFAAKDSTNGQELWRTDGTAAGTVLVKDINPGPDHANPKNLIHVNGTLFFTAYHPSYGEELWKSDGTAAGTILVKEIIAGINEYDSPFNNMTAVNSLLYFTTIDEMYRTELWKSDGTAAGTVLVKDINPGGSDEVGNLIHVNGTLFFTANNGTNGVELWKSDGTAAGTTLVKDIVSGGNGSYPHQLIHVDGLLYFVNRDNSTIWKSDGTAAGTTLFRDLSAIRPFPSITSLTYANGKLYFFDWEYFEYGEDGLGDLWVSEVAANESLIKLKDNFITDYFSIPSVNLVNINGILYFKIINGSSGEELWRTDGTPSGTGLIDGTSPIRSNTSWLTTLNNILYFNAFSTATGNELWKYDLATCVGVPDKNVLLQGGNVCTGQDGKIIIKASEANVRYQAFINNAALGVPVTGGGDITLTIQAVSLNSGNNQFTIKAISCTSVFLSDTATITVTATCEELCSATGSILQEVWLNVAGNSVSAIPVSIVPSSSTQLTSFETIPNQGDNYGERIRGYLCVPNTGTYTFYIAGDDKCELYLSTDDDPAKKTRIASVPYFTAMKLWTKYPEQKSIAIPLQAGKKYYIEALHKEGTGNDQVAVGWQTPAQSAISVIPGSVLSPYIPQGAGKLSREFWANVEGYQISNIPLTTAATTTDEVTMFEQATNQGNNYGQRFRGYLHPQVSGNYRFFIAGDDKGELYLSTDEDPAKKVKIASITASTSLRQWNKYASQQSAVIALVAGRKYYIEALHKENTGNDNISVGWQLPNQTSIAVIAGTYLSPFLASPTVSQARVGVEESFVNKVSLYPNPFESKLTLANSQAGKRYITVVDNLGRTIYQTTTQGVQTELNLAHLKTGVYVVKISAEDGQTQAVRVVKK
ncbi:T9SS type A sorting domain-containing protein [Rhodocytophaga rosea]|uniref:T9SS type A sorting domain-containing protein n=1 Tax=Rhodocytophaga rosea TaxID=2704465 RepID=A0A6C0GQU3_9BACT|nr:ELWxxDGT repeat protein [Rhodocytophaga rosea]QHT70455.1 T9SS type A sorting domain-containing protein [Rhodocytophaga rosea]